MKLRIATYVGKLAADYIAERYPNYTLKELHQQPTFLRAKGVRSNSKAKIKAISAELHWCSPNYVLVYRDNKGVERICEASPAVIKAWAKV